MDGVNPYSGMFGGEGEAVGSGEPQMRQSLLTAVDRNPDSEAQLQGLAAQYALPVEAVRLDRETVERRSRLDSVPYAEIVRSLPATGNLLSDPRQAAVAHDDVANLTALEKWFKFQANTRRALAAGYFGFGEGAAGVLQAGAEQLQNLLEPAAGTLLPVNPAQPVAGLFARIRRNQAAWRGRFSAGEGDYLTASEDGWRPVESGYYAGLQSMTQNLLTLPLAVAAGNPALALGGMAASVGGQSYGRARDAGLGPNQAALYAAADAAIEYGAESFGAGALFRNLKAGSPLLKTLGGFLARELPGEQAATVLQDMNEWLTLHPEKSLADYLAERPDAALQTAVATLVGGGGQVGVLHTVRALADSGRLEAANAEAGGRWLAGLNELAQSSRVLARSPQTMQGFVDDILRHHPAAARQVSIDAVAFMHSGVAEQVTAAMPELAAQLETALQTGGELEIPLADYVGKIAGNPALVAPLLAHLRLEGETYSQAEAAAYRAEHAETLQQDAADVLQQREQDARWQEGLDKVRGTVHERLDALGKNHSRANGDYAELMTAYFGATAERLGVFPDEFFDASGLNFAAPGRTTDGFWQRPVGGGPETAVGDAAAMKQGGDYRGQYFPGSRTIELLDNADLSTFLHEAGHFFWICSSS
ncbi:MAG: hypothetical protein PHW13_12000 [Methylococcales bacterium]|nr:hypothetical protein [Methylococcales bacterium]